MNKILIIDDEPTIRMLLSRILELEGYETLKAKDRATARYTLKKQEVQVVRCDVFLPDGNGVEMVEELQALALDMTLLDEDGNEVKLKETSEYGNTDINSIISGSDRNEKNYAFDSKESFEKAGFTQQEFNSDTNELVDVEDEDVEPDDSDFADAADDFDDED